MESWAVDLANVGAVYPWQGAEVIMVIVGIIDRQSDSIRPGSALGDKKLRRRASPAPLKHDSSKSVSSASQELS